MPQFAYSSTITLTNGNILELLSARFAHLGAPRLSILSFFNTI